MIFYGDLIVNIAPETTKFVTYGAEFTFAKKIMIWFFNFCCFFSIHDPFYFHYLFESVKSRISVQQFGRKIIDTDPRDNKIFAVC
jgi:hypothetical protein